MKKLINLSNQYPNLWKVLVKEALTFSTHIEFNILYIDKKIKVFMERNFLNIVKNRENNKKFYNSGESIRLKINEEIKACILNKEFSYWENNFIEDPSFFIEESEILASITHENNIMIDIRFFEKVIAELDKIDMYDLG